MRIPANLFRGAFAPMPSPVAPGAPMLVFVKKAGTWEMGESTKQWRRSDLEVSFYRSPMAYGAYMWNHGAGQEKVL